MMKIAIVGCTGLVGSEVLKVLSELKLPITKLIPVASSKSIGKEVIFNNSTLEVIGIQDAIKLKPNIAIFSAGGEISKKWANKFTELGTTVIDNSSAWRMKKEIPLIVPEINGGILTRNDKIISNPNCSTIQLVLALKNIHKHYGIKRLVISTYQSVTGTGSNAVKQLKAEREGIDHEKTYPYKIDLNCFPHGGDFLENG